MAASAVLEAVEDKTLLMKHAHSLLSCGNFDDGHSAEERKALNDALLSLVRQAFADGAAAAAVDANASAQADPVVGNVDSGRGGNAHDRAYPLSADEKDSAVHLLKALPTESKKILYAFEQGVLPHYLLLAIWWIL